MEKVTEKIACSIKINIDQNTHYLHYEYSRYWLPGKRSKKNRMLGGAGSGSIALADMQMENVNENTAAQLERKVIELFTTKPKHCDGTELIREAIAKTLGDAFPADFDGWPDMSGFFDFGYDLGDEDECSDLELM